MGNGADTGNSENGFRDGRLRVVGLFLRLRHQSRRLLCYPLGKSRHGVQGLLTQSWGWREVVGAGQGEWPVDAAHVGGCRQFENTSNPGGF